MNNPNGWQWEAWEDAVLERSYTAEGWKATHRQLPHRTKGAITSRASTLGLRGERSRQKRTQPKPTGPTYWTPAVREACALLTAWRCAEPGQLRARP